MNTSFLFYFVCWQVPCNYDLYDPGRHTDEGPSEKQVKLSRVTASVSVSIKDWEWRRDTRNQNEIQKIKEEYHEIEQ